jgi:hypothetical protein
VLAWARFALILLVFASYRGWIAWPRRRPTRPGPADRVLDPADPGHAAGSDSFTMAGPPEEDT